jgi:hypothetical protein
VVLDDTYRVVEVTPAAAPWFAQHIGKDVFECFPGSRPLFRPYYELARRTGQTVEFEQFYDGYVVYVRAVPSDAGLEVTWEPLAIVDTWTLEGLRSTLDRALARLDELSSELERERTRTSLRVVGGSDGK